MIAGVSGWLHFQEGRQVEFFCRNKSAGGWVLSSAHSVCFLVQFGYVTELLIHSWLTTLTVSFWNGQLSLLAGHFCGSTIIQHINRTRKEIKDIVTDCKRKLKTKRIDDGPHSNFEKKIRFVQLILVKKKHLRLTAGKMRGGPDRKGCHRSLRSIFSPKKIQTDKKNGFSACKSREILAIHLKFSPFSIWNAWKIKYNSF